MRLRVGVAMPERGGRSALVGVEVLEARQADGRLAHKFRVGLAERVAPGTIDAAMARLVSVAVPLSALGACVMVDVTTPQGQALRASVRDSLPPSGHRPHANPGPRRDLFASFLAAYSQHRVEFVSGLQAGPDLARALVLFGGTGRRKDGDELKSEDEALVVALCVAMSWPQHGRDADRWVPPPLPGSEKTPS